MKDVMRDGLGVPKIVDRSTFPAELDALWIREKAYTRQGDAIAAARRRLPMVEVRAATPLVGEGGAVTLLDVLRDAEYSSPITSCGTPASLRRSRRWTTAIGCSIQRSTGGKAWEDSPTVWPQRLKGKHVTRTDARHAAQWSRLNAGYSDDLGTGRH
jgi:hypothetical protein